VREPDRNNEVLDDVMELQGRSRGGGARIETMASGLLRSIVTVAPSRERGSKQGTAGRDKLGLVSLPSRECGSKQVLLRGRRFGDRSFPRGSADPDRHSASAVPHAFCLSSLQK
jgi:hypothetical protein